ncbi:MAG: HAMP domain-containing histidine kinase [Thaumarchaeota archaeon]|nr:HAMP domain-containing histidine kinase [Nitrososphaerota archaeon]
MGASVGIIILMLGVATVLSFSATSTINDQMRIMTIFNTPLEKAIIQMNGLQKIQNLTVENSVLFYESKDVKNFEVVKNQFYVNSALMTDQIEEARNIIISSGKTLPPEYAKSSVNSLSQKMDSLDGLEIAYLNTAERFFKSTSSNGTTNIAAIANELRLEEKLSESQQKDILAELQNSDKSIESTAHANKEKLLTLEVILIVSVGIISLTSSHLVNQINKDLILEVVKKTKSLQKANEKLRRLNNLKDEFISEASHELISPLNPIYGFVELAKCGDIDKEEALTGIAKQAHQIEEVANKMLDIGKIDRNRLQLSFEKFDLNELLFDIVQASRLELVKGVKIQTRLEGIIEVEADRTRIGQVVRNMINNSLKFTSCGTILVASSNDGTHAEVRIKDTGAGIHPAMFPNLFNKFSTMSNNKHNPNGNGLGLHLSKGIIDAHNGRIGAFNNPDGGATFFFSLPKTCQKAGVIQNSLTT